MKSKSNAVATTETLSAFARRLSVRPSYVTKLRQNDRLVMTPDNKVEVERSLARIEATRDPNRDDVRARHARERGRKKEPGLGDTVPVPSPEVAQISESYTRARSVKERYLALQAKLDYDRAIGLVVDTAVVQAAGMEVGTALRAALENLPDQLAPLVAPVADEDRCRRILQDHLEAILKETAARIERMGQQLATPPAT
jgi:hypothetical protein